MERRAPRAQDIDDFERTFGVLLPLGLTRLLNVANGGHPELDAVCGAAGQFSVNRFYHLCANDNGTESLRYAMTHWRPILGLQAIPFANTGGGDQFFIDLADSPPTVKLCLHRNETLIVQVAPSFEIFIDELAIDLDMI